jgi:hypothetical protein
MDNRTEHERIIGVREKCCQTWTLAHGSGTDNEGHLALINENRIGYELPPVKFCPWCAAPKIMA